MPTDNTDRAAWALVALQAFREVCHGSKNEDGSIDVAEAAGDLICNLMHLCDQARIDPLKMIQNGVCGYVVEKFEPDGMSHDAQFNYTVYARPHASEAPWRLFDWKQGA